MIPFSTLFVVAFLASADPKAEVLKKLDGAKADYKEVETLQRKSIEKAFDALEEAARKEGSKKAVDAAKQSREVFRLWGEYPATIPRAAMADARARLSKAYDETIKDLIKLKADDDSVKLEKEFQQFQVESAILAGKYTYASRLKPLNPKTLNNKWFFTNGTAGSGIPLQFKGLPVPHSILMVPSTQNRSQVGYSLNARFHTFRATIGVPQIGEDAQNPHTALTFELLGDDKSIWKSKPVEKFEEHQACEVSVEKVKMPTLVVNCPGVHHWAHAVWFEPILTDP